MSSWHVVGHAGAAARGCGSASVRTDRDDVPKGVLILASWILEDQDGSGEGDLFGSAPGLGLGRPRCREGFLESHHLLAQSSLHFGCLVRLGADPGVELLLQVGVALHQRHPVDVCLDGERGDRQTAVRARGLAGQQPADRLPDARARPGAAASYEGLLAELGAGVVRFGESAEPVGGSP